MLGLQVLVLKLEAWQWCPGLVGTQVPSMSEGWSLRWQCPRAGDVGMEGCRDGGTEGWRNRGMWGWRDAGLQRCGDGGMEGFVDGGMQG